MKGLDTRFVRTAARPDQFINDGLPQIAFAGRSNVGKSSVINCLTGKSSLARVSSVPGKTTSINYYLVNEKFYFVDLPGFGYARTSQAEKERWAALMEDYFNRSGLLSLGIQLVDIRHDPMPGDMIMTKWFLAAGARFIVAANKSDKISRSAVPENSGDPLRPRTAPTFRSLSFPPVSAQEKGAPARDHGYAGVKKGVFWSISGIFQRA